MTIERLMESDLEDINKLVRMHALYLRSPFCHPMKVMDRSAMVGIGTAICVGQNGWLAQFSVDARVFLERSGCAETRRMKRMIWVEPFTLNPQGLYNRIGGNLG